MVKKTDTGSICEFITWDMEMAHQYILTGKLMPTLQIH